jgi:hypothetical protein
MPLVSVPRIGLPAVLTESQSRLFTVENLVVSFAV